MPSKLSVRSVQREEFVLLALDSPSHLHDSFSKFVLPLTPSLKLSVVYQYRPTLDIVDIVPAKELEFIEVLRVLDSVHVVIVQDITPMVVGQDGLTTRTILQESAHVRLGCSRLITYDVIMATIDDVSTTILEIYTIAVDERSRG
jgi:hypothetical protein